MAMINEGLQYRLLIDPFLARMHNKAAEIIEPGSKVLDVACGNGTMALKMAERAGHVTGIDLSDGSLQFARKRAGKTGQRNTEFMLLDATNLSSLNKPLFDVATISMAIHQFSPKTGINILQQMVKISRSVLVIDYAYPQPGNFYGLMVRTIERIAGKEHFTHFNAYMSNGGMPGVLKKLNLSASYTFVSSSKIFTLMKIQ